ncbi:MAG: alkaline phosphatase family protein [Verrucomicrobiales bacterium]|nr:alkaline phosphatase family protein [Verrucomicrobiales bacterium]
MRFLIPSSTLIAMYSLVALVSTSTTAQAENPSSSKQSVILISIDGLRPDAILAQGPKRVPAFFRLRREGAFTHNARTAVTQTHTLPNHTGMVTSRLVDGPEGHAWTWNRDPQIGDTLHRNKGAYLHSMFSVAHDHGLRTALFASKTKFSLFDISWGARYGQPDTVGEDNGRDKIDVYQMKTRSENMVDDLETVMKKENFDLLMVHIRNPDTAGHGFQWKTEIPSIYMAAVKKADELLEDIFDHLEKPHWKGRTFVVLTADHGGPIGLKDHGNNQNPENFTVPFYVWGPGIPAGADLYALNPETRTDPGITNPLPGEDILPPIRNAGAGNLCLDLLGLPAIPGSTVNAKQDLKAR